MTELASEMFSRLRRRKLDWPRLSNYELPTLLHHGLVDSP
jgi:hypothetical protein